MEFVLRRDLLQTDQTKVPGLHPENKTKMTDKPTAERILQAFADVSLTIIKHAAGEEILVAADIPVRVTRGYPATARVRCFTLRAAS